MRYYYREVLVQRLRGVVKLCLQKDLPQIHQGDNSRTEVSILNPIYNIEIPAVRDGNQRV